MGRRMCFTGSSCRAGGQRVREAASEQPQESARDGVSEPPRHRAAGRPPRRLRAPEPGASAPQTPRPPPQPAALLCKTPGRGRDRRLADFAASAMRWSPRSPARSTPGPVSVSVGSSLSSSTIGFITNKMEIQVFLERK